MAARLVPRPPGAVIGVAPSSGLESPRLAAARRPSLISRADTSSGTAASAPASAPVSGRGSPHVDEDDGGNGGSAASLFAMLESDSPPPAEEENEDEDAEEEVEEEKENPLEESRAPSPSSASPPLPPRIPLPPFPEDSIHAPFEFPVPDASPSLPEPQPTKQPPSGSQSARLAGSRPGARSANARRTNCARCFRSVTVPAVVPTPPSMTPRPLSSSSARPRGTAPNEEEKTDRTSTPPFTVVSSIGSTAQTRPSTAGPNRRRPRVPVYCAACAAANPRATPSTPPNLSATIAPSASFAFPYSPPTAMHPLHFPLSARPSHRAPFGLTSPSSAVGPGGGGVSLASFTSHVSSVRDHRSLCLALASAEQLALSRALEVELVRRQHAGSAREKAALEKQVSDLLTAAIHARNATDAMRVELEATKAHVKDQAAAMTRLEEEHARLHQDHAQLQTNFTDLNDSIANLRDEHEAAKRAIDELRRERDDLLAESASAKEEVSLLRAQLVSSEEGRLAAEQLLSAAREAEAASAQQVRLLRPQMAAAHTSCAAAQQSADEAARLLALERQALVALQQAHSQLKAGHADLALECAATHEALARAEAAAAFHKAAATAERRAVTTQGVKSDTELLEALARLARAEQRADANEAKWEACEIDLTRARAEQLETTRRVETTRAARDLLARERDALEEARAAATTSSHSAQAALEAANHRIADLDSDLKEATRASNAFESEARHFRAAHTATSAREATLVRDLATTQKDLAQVRESLAQTRRELDALEQSSKDKESRLNARLSVARADLVAARADAASGSAERRSAAAEARSLTSRLRSAQEKLTRLQHRYDGLAHAHNDCGLVVVELEQMRRRMNSLESRNTAVHQKLANVTADASQGTSETARLSELYAKERHERKEAQTQLTTALGTITALESRLASSTSEAVSLGDSTAVERARAHTRAKEVKQLRKQLEDTANEHRAQLESSIATQARLVAAEAGEAQVKAELIEVKETLKATREQLKDMEISSTASTNQLVVWRRERLESEQAQSLAGGNLAELRRERDTLKSDMSKVSNERDELQAALGDAKRARTKLDAQRVADIAAAEQAATQLRDQATQERDARNALRIELESSMNKLKLELTREQTRARGLDALNAALRADRKRDAAKVAWADAHSTEDVEASRLAAEAEREAHAAALAKSDARLEEQTSRVRELTTKVRVLSAARDSERLETVRAVEREVAALADASGEEGASSGAAVDVHFMYRAAREQLARVQSSARDATARVALQAAEFEKTRVSLTREHQARVAELESRLTSDAAKHAADLRAVTATATRRMWLADAAQQVLVSLPPQLGLTVLNSREAVALNGGVLVTGLPPLSAAARSGVRVGDVLERVGEMGLETVESLPLALSQTHAGATLSLTVRRVSEDGLKETRLHLRAVPDAQQYTAHQLGVLARYARPNTLASSALERFQDEECLASLIAARGIKQPRTSNAEEVSDETENTPIADTKKIEEPATSTLPESTLPSPPSGPPVAGTENI